MLTSSAIGKCEGKTKMERSKLVLMSGEFSRTNSIFLALIEPFFDGDAGRSFIGFVMSYASEVPASLATAGDFDRIWQRPCFPSFVACRQIIQKFSTYFSDCVPDHWFIWNFFLLFSALVGVPRSTVMDERKSKSSIRKRSMRAAMFAWVCVPVCV